MLVPIDWLKDIIKIEATPQEIADKLLLHSTEVEEIIDKSNQLDKVVIGKIESIAKHPNADKLVICQVDIGERDFLQIVTGAPNVFEGAVVPVAMDGANLPNGTKIKTSELRGIKSQGMLCSEVELGLSKESAGIMILPKNKDLGMPFAKAWGMNGAILDLSILPNRGDMLSIQGIARELSAIYNIEFTSKNTKNLLSEEDILPLTIKLISDNCLRYVGAVIKGIQISSSPEWMQQRLRSVGINPINNIVDITNYIMYETGQPLHAFSYETLSGAQIQIRMAKNNERILLLDDNNILLTEDDLIIADQEKPLALAGIMGGKHSAIHEKTVNIILESACFDPICIRKTSFKKAIRTESSQRFEKGVDPERVKENFLYAVELIIRYCGGQISSLIQDHYPTKKKPKEIKVIPEQINNLLGINISLLEMTDILKKLGFIIKNDIVIPPSYRQNDIDNYADLAEEIGRIYGLNNIKSEMPSFSGGKEMNNYIYDKNNQIRTILRHFGLNEIVSYSMVSPDIHLLLKDLTPVKILNPLTSSESVLRTNLLISLLNNYDFNKRNLADESRIFEIGKIFNLNESQNINEELCVGFLFSDSLNEDFFNLKAIAEDVCQLIGTKSFQVSVNDFYSALHPGRSAKFSVGNEVIAILGEVHPGITEQFNIRRKLFFGQIYIERATKYSRQKIKFEKFSLFPTISRDISLWLHHDNSFFDLTQAINKCKSEILKDISLTDIYTSDKHLDRTNFLIKLTFQSKNGTLSEELVNNEFDRIIKSLNAKLNIVYS